MSLDKAGTTANKVCPQQIAYAKLTSAVRSCLPLYLSVRIALVTWVYMSTAGCDGSVG